MCGRIDLHTPPARLARIFNAQLGADVDPDHPPRWNVAPTSTIFGLILPGSEHESTEPESTETRSTDPPLVLHDYRWGLVPSWAKDRSVGNSMFNARAETVAEKPAFRSAFKKRRVALVVDGFFEWRKSPDKQTQPYYFTRSDGQPLVFAGLYEHWRDPVLRESPDPWLRSCAIITTSASADMDNIHDRMPVVLLGQEERAAWLDQDGAEAEELLSLLIPAPIGTLCHHAVDHRVGNVRNNDEQVIAPAPDPAPGDS
jgi:putative SOS response-associated peptidase YedK